VKGTPLLRKVRENVGVEVGKGGGLPLIPMLSPTTKYMPCGSTEQGLETIKAVLVVAGIIATEGQDLTGLLVLGVEPPQERTAHISNDVHELPTVERVPLVLEGLIDRPVGTIDFGNAGHGELLVALLRELGELGTPGVRGRGFRVVEVQGRDTMAAPKLTEDLIAAAPAVMCEMVDRSLVLCTAWHAAHPNEGLSVNLEEQIQGFMSKALAEFGHPFADRAQLQAAHTTYLTRIDAILSGRVAA
jgi:hypothetical protein